MLGEDDGGASARGVFARQGESFKYLLSEDEEGKAAKYALKRWDDAYKVQAGRVEQKRTRIINAKTELYQLVSLYVLFQGVVLTTVAKASNLKCHNSYGPAMFSALVSVAAIFGLHDRLLFYYDAKSALISEEAKARTTLRKINYVLAKGASFSFKDMDKDFPADGENRRSPGEDFLAEGENRPLLGDSSASTSQSPGDSSASTSQSPGDSSASTSQTPGDSSAFTSQTPQRTASRARDPEAYYRPIMVFISVFSALVFINCFTILCIH